MKTFRKVLFWFHLSAGVTIGLVILLMAGTGVLLTYEKQLTDWADTRTYRVTPPVPGAGPLPTATLLTQAEEAVGARPYNVTVLANPEAPVLLGFPNPEGGGLRTVYVDPYSGAVLGEGAPQVRAFFSTVTEVHRWFGLAGKGRSAGRAVTGAVNLVFLFMVLSGLYLWMPRRWTRTQLRRSLWFRRGRSGKARHFNWHNVIGFWCFLPLLIIVFTGVALSYPWAGDLVAGLAGEGATPARPSVQERERPADGPAQADAGPLTLDDLWRRVQQHSPGWHRITLRLPGSTEPVAAYDLTTGAGRQPQRQAQLTLDRQTGAVVQWAPFAAQPRGRQVRQLIRFGHTGEAAGLFGQTVAGLASLGALFLIYTGLALAWRRYRSWRVRLGRRQRSGRRPWFAVGRHHDA